MFENTYEFFRGLFSFEYEVPIPLQIAAYIILGIIITMLLYVFRDSLNMSEVRDKYMWYYFIAILNILNICSVLGYYYIKRGTYIGEPGKPGYRGVSGNVGSEMSCDLCEQNIFMIPTTTYELIAKMDFITLANNVINPELSSALTELNKTLDNNYFDYGEFSNNLINGTFDANNTLTNKLLLLSIYNEYPLIKYINETMGLSDPEATGYIKNPSGKPGYFRLSDMAFGGSENGLYTPTAFLVNGDIRTPIAFDKICTFVSVNESGTVGKYSVMRMIPPIDSKNTGNQEDNTYVSLGNIIIPADQQPDIMQYAMVKRKCVKKLSTAKLKLVFIYPAAAHKLAGKSAAELNKQQGGQRGEPISEGFFSIWRTPFSTVHVKFSNGDFVAGKSIIENLYLSADGGFPENIYTKSGTVKKVVAERVNAYLAKIRVPKVIFCTVLFGHTVEIIKRLLGEFVSKYVGLSMGSGNNNINMANKIMATPALRKCNQPDTLLISDVSEALRDIGAGIQGAYERELKAAEANIAKASKQRLFSVYNVGGTVNDSEAGENQMPDYLMTRDYDTMKNIINELSVQIENGRTLGDLFDDLFPGGMGTKLKLDTLTATQERVLNFIACMIPPEKDIYILKNECLAYEQIDEERQDITLKLEGTLKKLAQLTAQINSAGENETDSAAVLCGGEKNLAQINNTVTETYEFIANNIGHIPDYLKKLARADFEDFTTDKLAMIQGQVSRLVELIENKCELA